jgi:SUN domain-containing protein 1/2
MSFSATPLGQSRRLDHSTFLGKPEKWTVKDTSVNIATAFTQAATDTNPTTHNTNPNNSWASTSRTNPNVPRSTSVEYEATAPSAFNRKHFAPPPPDRLGRTTARKPPSKTLSIIRHVPDSEAEEDGRAKSPFERVLDLGKQTLSQATFYVQQRSTSREPEELSLERNQTPVINGNGFESSYDYADEEIAYQATQNKRIAQKRGRISVDNKAYKPPLSESESEFSEDGKTNEKTRRKKKRGPSVSMEGTEQGLHSIPLRSRTQIPRVSSYDDGDVSMEGAEQGLHSIPEEEIRSRTPPPRSQTPTPVFSVGGLLGNIVHYIIKVSLSLFYAIVSSLSLIAFIFGRIAGTIYDIILRQPFNWLFGIGPRSSSFTKYLVLGLIIFGSWYTLRGSLPSYLPNLSFPSRLDVYHAPEVPAGNIVELAERLRRLESAVSGLSADSDRTSGREYSKLLGRLIALEGRFSETKKVLEGDAQARNLVDKSLNGVKHDMEILQSQILAQQVRHEKEQGKRAADTSDAEARVKLKELEERVGTVEQGVKDSLDLGKKTSSSPIVPGPSSTWWNKLLANSKIQIKSSDGQDITALIHHLVDSAVSIFSQDILSKPDFALHSGGARIIPSLTSPTFEIRPQGLGSQMIGLITGNGYAIGRPPITALHHEMQNGHCWPFAGGEGQLGVVLASPIFMEEVTIDHVAKSIAFDMRSAPRRMEVWGLVEGKDNIARVRAWKEDLAARKEARQSKLGGEDSSTTYDKDGSDYEVVDYPKTLPKYPEYIRLANFTYNIHSPNNVQTFPVMPEIQELGVDFGIVVLRVLSNWGRDDFTCLYRFRVHGQQFGEIPTPYFDEDVDGQP